MDWFNIGIAVFMAGFLLTKVEARIGDMICIVGAVLTLIGFFF